MPYFIPPNDDINQNKRSLKYVIEKKPEIFQEKQIKFIYDYHISTNKMIFKMANKEAIEIKTIVLDLNGTLSVNGKIPAGAKKRLEKLKALSYKIILFTGDQRGTAKELCADLNIEFIITQTGKDKEDAILRLEPDTCASIGNARIDIGTFKRARLSVITLQAEGIHADVIKYADIIVPSINDALDLFINKDSLLATLKK